MTETPSIPISLSLKIGLGVLDGGSYECVEMYDPIGHFVCAF